jgi:hypothetical protein
VNEAGGSVRRTGPRGCAACRDGQEPQQNDGGGFDRVTCDGSPQCWSHYFTAATVVSTR